MSVILRLPRSRPFTPRDFRWRLAGHIIQGPERMGLPPVMGTTEGGGWWTAELNSPPFNDPVHHRAVRALALKLRGGRVVDVPFTDPAPLGSTVVTGFSDGTSFTDGTGFSGGTASATLEMAASLRADEATVRVTSGHIIRPGHAFSLFRSVERGSELHMVDEVSDLGGGLFEITFGPNLRQGYPAGAALDFNEPRCAMRLVDPDGGLWPSVEIGGFAKVEMKFAEAL